MADTPFGFPTVTKDEWLEQVLKERNGKDVEALDWQISEDIRLSPFFHRDDLPEVPRPHVRGGDKLNSFESGILLQVENIEASNRLALQSLQAGTNSLLFDCRKLKGDLPFRELLSEIHLDYISTHFLIHADNVVSESHRLAEMIHDSEADIGTITGSICNSRLTDLPRTEPSLRELHKVFPKFRNMWIDGSRLYRGSKYVKEELTDMIHVTCDIISNFLDAGWTWDEVVDQMKIGVIADHDYFLSIAKFRALKELLKCLFDRLGGDTGTLPEIEAYCIGNSNATSENHWLIQMTSASMSAVIGGVDRIIYGSPFSGGFTAGDSSFVRIGQNIHQLINYESHLTGVQDPLAGSYFMENLTTMLADKSWETFRKRL